MSALRAHHRGGPEVLIFETAPVPIPAVGEVLVAVHAAGITFDELTWEETWTRDGQDRTPVIPSHEVCGVIADTGPGVTGWAVGDQVYGLIRFDRDGAAADYVTVPAADLASRPSTVSHVVSAALPLAGLTALQALVTHADVQPGEDVLVHGGAGAVGGLTIQLARYLEANVATTIRSDVGDHVRDLGATRVIDTRTEEFDDSAARYDVVIDTVGGATLQRSFAVLRPGGRLVTLSAPPPEGMAERYDVRATFFVVTPDHDELGTLADLADRGELRVPIADTFPLQRGREAFANGSQPHRLPGKTVIIVVDEVRENLGDG
jgi:NADPH:quinone reductase-like Zn-dependent oxidoreductase